MTRSPESGVAESGVSAEKRGKGNEIELKVWAYWSANYIRVCTRDILLKIIHILCNMIQ